MKPLRPIPLLLAAGLAVTACGETPVTPLEESPLFGHSATVSYSWHAGGPTPTAIGVLDFGAPTAVAPNGETIQLIGSGLMSLHPKSVSGGGTYTRMDPNGNVVGSGTWTATRLKSFKPFGDSALGVFLPGTSTGRMHLRVTLHPESGGNIEGNMTIDCQLPDVVTPPSIIEGVRLGLTGGPNFNKVQQDPFTGGTLFIRQ